MRKNKIRVMIIDDSSFFRQALRTYLNQDELLEVVGEAPDARSAEQVIQRLKPDVITLDVEMPGMNGLEFLRTIMPKYDIPVVVVSSANNIVFDALNAGAVDFVAKPDAQVDLGYKLFIKDLKTKIKISSIAKRRVPTTFNTDTAARSTANPAASLASKAIPSLTVNPAANQTANTSSSVAGLASKTASPAVRAKTPTRAAPPRTRSQAMPHRPAFTAAPKSSFDIIAMGASTGGTEALYEIIKNLPADLPGIVIVQHMPPVFTQMYAQRLDQSCILQVKEARDRDKILPGTVLIAPGDFHMRLVKAADGTYYVRCEKGERVSGHCPSVDVLFESVAATAANKSLGLILTGMGADGAKGLLAMRHAGAVTLGQDEQSSVVYGMPKVAYDLGAVQKQLPIGDLAAEILRTLSR